VRATGEIDLWTAPTLERHLRRVIDTRPHMVVVDLSRVEFMDSACAHALLSAATAARAAAVSLIVHRPPSPVDQVLDLCIPAPPPAPLVP
jgi:anti-sigma B factor antagonist